MQNQTITLWQTIAAPWISFARPGIAARRMAHSSPLRICASIAVCWAALSIIFIVANVSTSSRIERHTSDYWTSVAIAEIAMACGMVMVLLVAALLSVPRIPVGAPPRRVVALSVSAIASSLGVAVCSIILSALASMFATHMSSRRWNAGSMSGDVSPAEWPELLLEVVPLLAFSVWTVWAYLAVRSVRDEVEPNSRASHCEGCGYHLTHQSDVGRCTECGLELSQSVRSDLARPGTSWERRGTPFNWLRTSTQCLFAPRRLFRRLPIAHDDSKSVAFSLIHLAALGVTVFAYLKWYARCLESFGLTLADSTLMSLNAALAAIFWMGLLHRIVGFVACRIAARDGMRAAGQRLARIVDYQVVLIWPSAIVAMCYSRLTGWPLLWIGYSPLPYASRVLGSLPTMPTGTLGQLLWWSPLILLAFFYIHRYRIAFRATRFANF